VPFGYIFCNKDAAVAILSVFIGILSCLFFVPTLALKLKDLGLSTSETGLGFASVAFTYGISCPIMGFISTSFSRKIVINVAIFIIAFSVFLVGPS
jgi:MFS family permease